MFVMDASSKQTGLNAYVSGFGASKPVVVWDNTIAKATVPETLFVFGHEMDHYVLLHIPKGIAICAVILSAAGSTRATGNPEVRVEKPTYQYRYEPTAADNAL